MLRTCIYSYGRPSIHLSIYSFIYTYIVLCMYLAVRNAESKRIHFNFIMYHREIGRGSNISTYVTCVACIAYVGAYIHTMRNCVWKRDRECGRGSFNRYFWNEWIEMSIPTIFTFIAIYKEDVSMNRDEMNEDENSELWRIALEIFIQWLT